MSVQDATTQAAALGTESSDDGNSLVQGPIKCTACKVILQASHRFCFNCGKPALHGISLPPRDTATTKFDTNSIGIKSNEKFLDRFYVKKILGSGGMGLVYLVEDIDSGIDLALKVLKPEFSTDTAAISRFQREIRILAKIRHPSIPRILEWGTHNKSIFFVTEYINGEDLGQIIATKKALPTADAISIIINVTEALGSAHQQGIIHRDIKPSNIMLGKDGNVHLIDFGVSRATGTDITKLTESGLFIGTPQYMAPEQLDSRLVDERSDIYSLGVVLFEVLTGELPFDGNTPMAIATRHLKSQPPSPRSMIPSIPFWLEKVVLRCLEKDPVDRFWTTKELLRELRKTHKVARSRRRILPNGDIVIEDPSESNGWVLAISSRREKSGWGSGVALYYKDAFYRVTTMRSPGSSNPLWKYFFSIWPENRIITRVVDFEAEASIQSTETSIFSRAKKWIQGRRQ